MEQAKIVTEEQIIEHLQQHPELLPKQDDRLYHFSFEQFDNFAKFLPGNNMYLTKRTDEGDFVAPRYTHLITLRVKKNFSLEDITNYQGEHRKIGWGVRLTSDGRDVKWLSISNELLTDYLEIVDVQQLPRIEITPHVPSPKEVRLRQQIHGIFLTKLLQSPPAEVLESERTAIDQAVTALLRGELATHYTIEQISQRYAELGWRVPDGQ